MNKNGLLISFEGVDGSGKSSLAQAVYKKLITQNYDVLLTKEPGDTPLGNELRILLHEHKSKVCDKAEFLLFAADRAQHFEEIVIPALNQNKIVLSDRMADSSLAYQGYGRGLNLEIIKSVNNWAMCKKAPDITFYIKIDFTIALPRVTKRGEKLTSFEKEEQLFWERVTNGFEAIFKDRTNVITLDGTRTIDELAQTATNEIIKRYAK